MITEEELDKKKEQADILYDTGQISAPVYLQTCLELGIKLSIVRSLK